MIVENAYDDSPKYKGVVVRTWSHHYGGPEGLALFATVDHLWGGEAFEDASDELLRGWKALSEAARTPLPPPQQPVRGDLLDRLYGT